MQFGRFPRKTLLAATLLLAFSAANASFLEQTGKPATQPVAMKTYGVDVGTRVGLKAVIPTGWQLYVHKSVVLPDTLSWKMDESWVSVLTNFAKANDIAVLVDWDKQSVYFRSTEMALKEQEQRQMIAQAAATPLPAFKNADKPVTAKTAATPAATAPTVAAVPSSRDTAVAAVLEKTAPALTETPKLAALDVKPTLLPMAAPVTTPTTADPVKPTSKAVDVKPVDAKPVDVKVAETKLAEVKPAEVKVEAKPATSIASLPSHVLPTDPPAPRIAATNQAPTFAPAVTASKPAATVSVVKPVTHSLSGPALAATTPLPAAKAAPVQAVITKEPAKVAPVVTPQQAPVVKPVVADATPMFRPVEAAKPAVVPTTVATTTPAVVLAPAVAAAPAQLAVSLTPGAQAYNRQPVGPIVDAAATKHGYTLSWEAGDLQFPGAVTILGADMGEDMKLVLRALGGRQSPISIQVYRDSKIVVVRKAAVGSAEVAFRDGPFSGMISEKKFETAPVQTFAVAPVPPAVQPNPVPTPVVPVVAAAPARIAPVLPVPAPAVAVAPAPVVTQVPAPMQVKPAVAAPVATVVATAAPVVVAQAKPVVLDFENHTSLREAIEAALEPGWTLECTMCDELVPGRGMKNVQGATLQDALSKVLPRLNLSLDIWTPSKVVQITPATVTFDK